MSRLSALLGAVFLTFILGPLAAKPGEVLGLAEGRDGPSAPGGRVSELINPFDLFLQTTVRGGLTAEATCINYNEPINGGPTGGLINLDSLPPGATVLRAYIYWTVLSNSFPVPSGNPTIGFQPVTPIPLGSVPRSPCFSQSNTGTFRADVTPMVLGNGAYFLSGFLGNGTGDGDITEGVTMLVIYCDPNAPLTDIVIWEGVDVVNETETTFSQEITGFNVDPTGPVSAFLAVAAGNGQSNLGAEPDPFLFNGTDLDQIYPEILSGGLCPGMFYDLTAYDVSPYVAPGSDTATLSATLLSDCYTFAAIGLAVNADPAGAVDECGVPVCGGTVVAPSSVTSCGGAAVDVILASTFPDCPLGPAETATQATDPIVAMNDVQTSDLTPAATAATSLQATLSMDLTGDTDLTACVEIALVDPGGTPRVVKAAGAAFNSPYDVTADYTGPGTYRVQLTELAGCGPGNNIATLAASSLEVVEDTGRPPVEFRVEDQAGFPLCDWNPDPICGITPRVCPGAETLIARARCAFEPNCDSARFFDLFCSAIQADFLFDAPCGTTTVCFQDATSGALGNVAWSWNFAGEGGSTDPDPCFSFTGPSPWQVTLQTTDDAGCESQSTQMVVPESADPPLEPSPLDIVPTAPPLRVFKTPVVGQLGLTWQDVGADADYHLYRGDLGGWYSHAPFGHCGLTVPSADIVMQPGSAYFIVSSANCAGEESSHGRRSPPIERPVPAPCP